MNFNLKSLFYITNGVVIFLTTMTAAGLFDALPISNPETQRLVGILVVVATGVFTGIKQKLSELINTGAAMKLTVVLGLLIPVLGGVLELSKVIDISDKASMWVRFANTFILFIINFGSTRFFPEK